MNGLYDNLLMSYFGTKEYKINYSTIPTCIEDVSGMENTLTIVKQDDLAPTLMIEKSNDGSNWTLMGYTGTTAISSTIPANGKLFLRCNTNTWKTDGYSWSSNLINCINDFNLSGNILSLFYGSDFTGIETEFPDNSPSNFQHVFRGSNVVDASNFIIPVTNEKSYVGLFVDSVKLISAPVMSARRMLSNCYNGMFSGCISLTTPPILPATVLDVQCYAGMFYGCTSLTTAPALPVTDLDTLCYASMFYGCTSLRIAPELPATILKPYCYQSMFNGCTNLNYIKCLATDISASNCTTNWTNGVAATGTFVKDSNMSRWTTDSNGIPSGWTVQDA